MHQYDNFLKLITQIMQLAKLDLDKEFFCELHGVHISTLNRWLSGKTQCPYEMIAYICQEIGVEKFVIKLSNEPISKISPLREYCNFE